MIKNSQKVNKLNGKYCLDSLYNGNNNENNIKVK